MSRLLLPLLFLLLTLTNGEEASCPAVRRCLAALSMSKRCPLLPVRRRNLPPPPPPEGFVAIRPGVFTYTDNAYRSMILYKAPRLTIIDFPDSASSFTPTGEYRLIIAINRILRGQVPEKVDMVYSHRHTDHIGRAGMVKQFIEDTFPDADIAIWGSREVLEFVRERGVTKVPEPTVIVGDAGATIRVGRNLRLNLSVVGGHTQEDLASHVIPSSDGIGILHYVDVITPSLAPFLDFGFSSNLFRTIAAQREVLKLEWSVLSAGHGRLGSKFDVRRNIRYTEFVINAAREAFSEVPPEKFARINRLTGDPEAVQFANGAWNLIAPINVLRKVCVRKTIQRWGCLLTAVDLVAPSHCKEAIIFLSVES